MNVPLVSLIFLRRSLVFPILLFSSISLHWSLRKAFLSFLAISKYTYSILTHIFILSVTTLKHDSVWNRSISMVFSNSEIVFFMSVLYFHLVNQKPPKVRSWQNYIDRSIAEWHGTAHILAHIFRLIFIKCTPK